MLTVFPPAGSHFFLPMASALTCTHILQLQLLSPLDALKQHV
jgi:hypothetical protein